MLDIQGEPMHILLSVSDWEKTVAHLEQLALLEEAKRNLARAEANPGTVMSHDELKRLMIEKRIKSFGNQKL
jgi:DNA-binding transcriptional regulator/RsmH inhibitor MraZ